MNTFMYTLGLAWSLNAHEPYTDSNRGAKDGESFKRLLTQSECPAIIAPEPVRYNDAPSHWWLDTIVSDYATPVTLPVTEVWDFSTSEYAAAYAPWTVLEQSAVVVPPTSTSYASTILFPAEEACKGVWPWLHTPLAIRGVNHVRSIDDRMYSWLAEPTADAVYASSWNESITGQGYMYLLPEFSLQNIGLTRFW